MRASQRGVTVIELVVVIAVIAIMAGVAMPLLLGAMQTARIDGAVRTIVSDLRNSQSLAVSRGGCAGVHFGIDPAVSRPNEFRTERNANCSAVGWPAPTDFVGGNPNVISNWYNLPLDYQGISITALKDNAGTNVNGVIFDSRGVSLNPFVAISHPVKITVSDASGATRVIEVKAAGRVQVP